MLRQAVKTIAAIDAHAVAKQEEPHRAHLGASVIGDECSRKLWYLFHWTKAEQFEGRMLRLFNRGQEEEKVFVAYLRGIGCEVWEKTPEGKQWRIVDVDGHFGGSLDGVARGLPDLPKDEAFLCEFKTHNDKSFGKLVTDGLMRTKWKHFVQMQVYMFKMGLKFAVYFAINKNDDRLFVEIIAADRKEGLRAIERARMIIYSPEPPPRIGATPAAWQCKFCHLQRFCHFGDVQPERNCRTCHYGQPATDANGKWVCTYIRHPGDIEPEYLDEAAQRAGCDCYTINPKLVGRQP